MKIIKADNVVYEYIRRDEEGNVEGKYIIFYSR